jgi:uncharacterized protein (DUF952 family)
VRLFHLVEPAAWTEALAAGAWRPPSLAGEGFVHLSHGHQLAGTLAAHYAAATRLLLLELDPERTRTALCLEPSRAGEPFPHLYRPLEPADVLRHWPLARGGDGWSTPALSASAALDRPAGRPGPP